jgi:hypothetical protein
VSTLFRVLTTLEAEAAVLVRKLFTSLVLASTLLAGSAPIAVAQEDASTFKDLATGQDFRVRVAAALALGKSRAAGARTALEKALGDSHPAVRAAAAAALGALGDATAIAALKKAAASESTASVKAQMDTTLARLASAGSTNSKPATKPKFLVSLGKIENKTAIKDGTIVTTLRQNTRQKMAQVPGIEVLADGADASSEGKSRGLPAFTLDGTVVKLAKKQSATDVTFSARVEYLIRKMPDQALKGTMSGAAEAAADVRMVKGQNEMSQLQVDAVAAAVDSAMRGATPALEAAGK